LGARIGEDRRGAVEVRLAFSAPPHCTRSPFHDAKGIGFFLLIDDPALGPGIV